MKGQAKAEGLIRHHSQSHQKTRDELNLALARLRNNNPRIVKRGTKITVTSVAQEAGVDPSTIYRFHESVRVEIRKASNAAAKKQPKENLDELQRMEQQAKEYRLTAEELQSQLHALAQQNYVLSQQLQEQKDFVTLRDKTIANLQERLKSAEKVVPLRPVD
jgi:hypothetical protein